MRRRLTIRYPSLEDQNGGLFVNRMPERLSFTKDVQEQAARRETPGASVFYGGFGLGKSALLAHLEKRTITAPLIGTEVGSASIDADEIGAVEYWDALLILRNRLAQAAGIIFPAFDLAFTDYWSKTFSDKAPMVLGAKLLGTVADLTQEGIFEGTFDTVKNIFGKAADASADILTDGAAALLPGLGPALKRVAKAMCQTAYLEALKNSAAPLAKVYRDKNPHRIEIRNNLADILAHEFALRTANSKKVTVLFLDSYESFLARRGLPPVEYGECFDGALTDLIAAFRAHRAGVLIAVFCRERLPWDDDMFDDSAIATREIKGLTGPETREFLDLAKVKKSFADKVLATFGDEIGEDVFYAPRLISELIDYYKRNAGRNGRSVDDCFPMDGPELRSAYKRLLKHFVSDYDEIPQLMPMLRRLSCCNEFDTELIDHLNATFRINYEIASVSAFLTSQMVVGIETRGDGEPPKLEYKLRRAILEPLQNTLDEDDIRATNRAAYEFYRQKLHNLDGQLTPYQHCIYQGRARIYAARALIPFHEQQLGGFGDANCR